MMGIQLDGNLKCVNQLNHDFRFSVGNTFTNYLIKNNGDIFFPRLPPGGGYCARSSSYHLYVFCLVVNTNVCVSSRPYLNENVAMMIALHYLPCCTQTYYEYEIIRHQSAFIPLWRTALPILSSVEDYQSLAISASHFYPGRETVCILEVSGFYWEVKFYTYGHFSFKS